MAILLGIGIGIMGFGILNFVVRISSWFNNRHNYDVFLSMTIMVLVIIGIFVIRKSPDFIATQISFIVTMLFFQGLILFSMVRKKKLTGKVHPEK